MRVDLDIEGQFITVRLSRRNLEAMIHMLDAEDKMIPALSARDDNFEILVLPEENEQHYSDRPAGVMSWER